MVPRGTRPTVGSEKRSLRSRYLPTDGRERGFALRGGLCYRRDVATVVLSYKLKLFPTSNKADTLALLTRLFCRSHAVATQHMAEMDEPRIPSCKGLGEFAGRAYRRAAIDYSRCLSAHRASVKTATKQAYRDCLTALQGTKKRGTKEQKAIAQAAGRQAAEQWDGKFKPPFLKAELIDAAQVQEPRHATSFDLWIMVQGVGKLYIPAKKHRAVNRALRYPGATLCEQGEIFRSSRGAWYVRVGVKIPLPEVTQPRGWIGVDIGVRAAVTRSDGYRGPDLRPVLNRQRARKANDQHRGVVRRVETSSQRQLLSKEARRVVSVAQRTGRGVAVEDPARLIRWKAHAARFFGTRVALLASLVGVTVCSVAPPYTSTDCSACGAAQGFRQKEMFRCLHCGKTRNADFNASVNISHRATYDSCTSHHGSLSLCPGGGKAE